MPSPTTMRCVLLAFLVALPASAAVADGTSNTILIGERSFRCERIQPDPTTLESGGPGTLHIWLTTGFFGVVDTDGAKAAEVRLVSEGPEGRRVARLSGVELKPAAGAVPHGGRDWARGVQEWVIKYVKILVVDSPAPAPAGTARAAASGPTDDILVRKALSLGLQPPGSRRVIWVEAQLRRGLPERLPRGEGAGPGKVTLHVPERAAVYNNSGFIAILPFIEESARKRRRFPKAWLRFPGGETVVLEQVRFKLEPGDPPRVVTLEYLLLEPL